MKIIAWILGIIFSLIFLAYIIAFTSFGNSIIAPTIELKIKEQTKMDSKLSTFSLSMSEIDVILEISEQNIIKIKGNYSLFSQSFDLNYKVELNNLASLKPLTNVELRNSLFTNGKVKGDMAFMNIDGVSDVASSTTTYHIELKDLNPTSIIAKINGAKLDELLEMGAQKNYADAKINLDVNFKNIVPNALDGDVVLKTKNGSLNTKVMRDDFNISIPPKTAFAMGLNAKLKGADIIYSYELASNLFKVTSSGSLTPTPLKLNVKYALDIKELELLKPLSGVDVRGSLKVDGTAKGVKEKLIVDAISDVASSETVVLATLEDFETKSVKARIKHLDIAKALFMLKQPHYSDGKFFLDADITNARASKLKGEITTSISDGLLDSNYITKTYEFKSKMPRTLFKLDTKTSLDADRAISKVDLDSSLANLNIKNAVVNIKSGKIKSDYKLNIPNLDSLYFATAQHLRGSLSANGDFTQGEDMTLNLYSKVAGGELVAKLHNDDLKADIKNIQTLDALHMLIYPEMFKSSLDAKLDYNLALKKGKLRGQLKDGEFTKNEMLDLIKQYARIDMYAERFKGDVSADINVDKITASLELKSNTSSIKTKDTKLDTKANSIDSKIDIVANKHPISVTLWGNISSPKVSVDAKELIKKEAQKVIKKEVNKIIEKEVGKSLDKEVGKLLKGFF
ncbi:hypothetical protein M947_03520 [Sulfurimonas hongkongensis]|uniref:AsmA-like C-terminal domain-containing protein n=1 Tax=Sulfurimonas hongkongensis TaxID=1172190 RepID=T0KSY8_9BACT|nr:hypothetical protein [Sulfurimonas hongkongensis]EQB40104.1 hypothetical protein M947_03520 [Sulfurimonas hongkongensis]